MPSEIVSDYFPEDILEFLGTLHRAEVKLSVFWGGNIPGIRNKLDFCPGEILQFGVPPQRVDLLNKIDGVSFAEVWESKVTATILVPGAPFEVHMMGIEALLKNKRASGHPKDLQDVQFFEQG